MVWPVTTWRALQGFGVSFLSARAGDHWANLFSTIAPAQFLPAIMTLSPKTGTELGALGGGLVTAVLVATGIWTIFRARDRTGLLLTLSGAAALALYTATTDFSYGWQKTMQFAAVSLSAVLPAGGIALAVAETRGWRQIAAAGVAAFFVFAQAIIELDLLKWSERKALAADWLQLDATVRARGATCVAIDPRTFSQPFFHAMWAPYFLGRVPATLFVERGAGTGGYLRASIVSVPADAAPGASLVGRAWADTLDANSPRLLAGRDFALLDRVNRLLASSGLQPSVGVPQRAAPVFSLTVLPHAAAELQVEIVRDGSAGIWEVANDLRVGGQSAVSEPGRWTLRVRLVGGRAQTIAFRFVPAAASPTPPTFELRRVAIQ
ncbi:hypothetical protein [Oleiharenicola sp. Vm1]|uniref:hypothetical protein n=1 Tax=Oleiharenicola sp. Vm1 TaxID=3398393 RepID=UPI0039F4F340